MANGTTLRKGDPRAKELSIKAAEARKKKALERKENPIDPATAPIKITLRSFIKQGLTEDVCKRARETIFSLFDDPNRIISALQYVSPVLKSEIEDDEKKNVVSEQDMEIIKWFRNISSSLMEKINEIAPPDDKDPS